ncbi:amino acid adenylation domain-containing protein [Lysinibacillus sp. NPDC048646]|uniref:amino acid adenylation domain-containing protein n=1 Tax=Lysinibacillus sp. NPDC048646 TaxID=3390574 RepID=UPI003CFFF3FF
MTKLKSLSEIEKKQLLKKVMSGQSDNIDLASLGQTRLWLLNELDNSSQYNINTALHIEGKIDEEILQSSITEIVKRHDSLRTTLPNINGKPHQVVTPNVKKLSGIDEFDFSNISMNSNEFLNVIKKEVNVPFNLQEGPLFKTKLFKFKNNHCVLVFIMHHAISDGWSTGILLRDFIEIYNKKMININASLTQLDCRYTDFSRWQRKILQQNSFKGKIEFWRKKLSGDLPILQLPTDYPRQLKQTYNGKQIEFVIEKDTFRHIREYCQNYNVTLFMFLLGAYKSMLYKYTNQEDIIIGIPVANREKTEFEEIMGYFGNTIALRSKIHGDMCFEDILKLVKDTSLEALENQEVPFEKVVESVKPDRNDAYPPIFQSMFVLQNDPINIGELRDLKYDILDIHTDTAKYDITLNMTEKKGYLIGKVEYNSDLFKESKIKILIDSYVRFIQEILKDSTQLLKSFSILDKNEINAIQDKQHNVTEFPRMKSVQDVFLDIVNMYGAMTALHSQERTLTYRELEERSNKLANYLIENGAKRGQKIGMLLKRSSNSIEAILAILKVGCCYVPIDPDYPEQRIKSMIEDSDVNLILSDSNSLTYKSDEILTIDMDFNAREIASQSLQRPNISSSGEDIAYVMYTSGSTGTPKGVEITHKSIIRLVKNTNYHDSSKDEAFILFSTLSFDASTFEIFGSLLNGCKLVIFPPELPTLDDLSIFIKDHKITTIFLTAGLFQQLNDDHINNMKGLKKLLTGGDAIALAVAKKFKVIAPDTILMNVYGPTENTTFSTFYEVSKNEDWNSPLPIGKAISNTTLYVLDKDLNLLPDRVPGELYLGGDGISIGYLKREELNQEKFIKNPFENFEDPILYKTGDRVQRLEDGSIEFLGRIDNQVKIRGFRVELGEIEHVLSRHKEIKEVVVTIKQTINSGKQLIAYVVSDIPSQIIREYLVESVPNYMIPSYIININKFPLKINGKIDIDALPEPSIESKIENFNIDNYTNKQLWFAEIWSEYLGINKEVVGLDNDFFELGGDSILAIQIISKINKSGYKLSPKHLLENRTIRKLANISQHYKGEKIVQSDLAEGDINLTPIQKWFFYQDLPNKNHFNMSQLYEVNVDKKHLEIALQRVINNHDAFRIRFKKADEGHKQYYKETKEKFTLQSLDMSNVNKDKQETIFAKKTLELQEDIDIYNGPLIKCIYFKRNTKEKDLLFVTAHHLIMDGISWRVFTEDLISEYNNLKEGMAPTLLKTSTFKKWAEYLKEYAQSAQIKKEANYWLEGLTGKSGYIPTDYNKNNTRESADMISKVMSAKSTKILLSEVHKKYNTQINDILITALTSVMRNWTKNSNVLINLEGHGRENQSTFTDISRTIGWFTSIFPLEISTKGSFDNDLGAAIKSVKEQLRRVPQKGWSYGLARYLLEDEKVQNALNSKQKAEISFNYMGRFSNGTNENSITPSKYHVNSDRTNLGLREHLIEINCSVQDDQLIMNWTYSKNKHSFETIDKIASHYIDILEKLISHCKNKLVSENTPSDFPLATLNQSELESIEKIYQGNIEDIWNPSPMQEGMLYHTLYDEKKSMYYVQSCSELHGELDISLFNEAWNIVINKNDILRSHFIFENIKRPLLLVNKNTPFDIEVYDRTNYSIQENDEFYNNLIAIDREESIDLLRAPLMKIKLVNYNEYLTKMIWGYHHAIMDGWTYTLIINELMSIYKDLKRNQNYDKSKKPSYGNYLSWRNEKENQNKSKDFWSRELEGIMEPTLLNIEKTNKEGNVHTNNSISLLLSTEESQKLYNSAKLRKVSLNTLCLGSWALVLSKYSKNHDIIFGVTGSGRSTEIINSENIVGLFINTLPIRIKVGNEAEIGLWLKSIQNKQWELREYEHSSLTDIKEWSDMENSSPLFNQIFVFENYPSINEDKEQKNELLMKNRYSLEHTNYPMSITVKPGKQIEFEISYLESVYSEFSVRSILEHLKNAAVELSNAANSFLSDIKILSEEEKYKIINEFNHEIKLPENGCGIISIFEEAAKQNASNIAVRAGCQSINYQELEGKANLLAYSLISKGVKKNDLIGLSMNKSIDLIVGLLGILKAGAAYVPIDPTYPKQRIAHMINDSNIELIISNDEVINKLKIYQCNILTVDELTQENTSNKVMPLPYIESSDVCYVNYTSGSTGKPKGVMITHGNLVNMYKSWKAAYKLTETNAHLQMANLSFDVFTGDWVRALCSGKKLVLCESIQLLDSKKLYNLMSDEKVDIAEFVPVVLRTLISYLDNENKSLDFMKLVICGSDSWYTSEYNYFLKFMGPNTRLINSFGLTEATIDSSFYERNELFSDEEKLVPIGKPFMNQQLLILDENQELLPINVPGELYIGGAGVSKGYVNNEEMNKRNFLINQWDKNNVSYMYKTGDMARFLEDGNVELLGRADSQIKVRGFRIEIGEIELALKKHPLINKAVVLVHSEAKDNKVIVGYIQAYKPLSKNDYKDIKQFLAEYLPWYMIPAFIEELEKIPITPNGKIDKLSLPSLRDIKSHMQPSSPPPSTENEKILQQIWGEVLDMNNPGIEENFYDLGGNSLLAIQLTFKINKHFNTDITIKDVISNPTIISFAKLLN